MSVLLEEMSEKAQRLGIPLSVQVDLTYRCNERCVHCYLDHDDHGEMTTAEIKSLLRELAEAGVFVLTLSGGEIMLRRDFFEILEHARKLTFCIKLKTNAILIGAREAERIKSVGVESIQVSIYSHRPEIHDAITKVPGSLHRSLSAIRLLKACGLKVIIANVLMAQNRQDYPAVRALAAELDVDCTLDPTITPKMDGDRSILGLNVDHATLTAVSDEEASVDSEGGSSAPAAKADDSVLDSLPCSAGHNSMLRFPLWGRLPLRTVSPAERQRSHAEVSRDLAPLRSAQRSALDPLAGPDELLAVRAWRELYALPRTRLHRRQYARPFDPGLRKILRANRDSLPELALASRKQAAASADSRLASHHMTF